MLDISTALVTLAASITITTCVVAVLLATWFWDRSPQQKPSSRRTVVSVTKRNCLIEPTVCDVDSDCKDLCVESDRDDLVCRQINQVGSDSKSVKVCGSKPTAGGMQCNYKFGGMNVFQAQSRFLGSSFACISSVPEISATKGSQFINNGVCNGPEINATVPSISLAPTNEDGNLGGLGLNCKCPPTKVTLRNKLSGLLFCAPITPGGPRFYAEHFEYVTTESSTPPQMCDPERGGAPCSNFFKTYAHKWDDGTLLDNLGVLQTDKVVAHMKLYLDDQDFVYGHLHNGRKSVAKGCALNTLPENLDTGSMRTFLSTDNSSCPLVDRSSDALARGFGSETAYQSTVLHNPCHYLTQDLCNESLVAYSHNTTDGWVEMNGEAIDDPSNNSLLYMAVCKWHKVDGTCRPVSERSGRTGYTQTSFIDEIRYCQSLSPSSSACFDSSVI